jgi:hypothetical protein
MRHPPGCAGLARIGHGLSTGPQAPNDLETLRAQSRKRSTTGLSVRFFNLTSPTGHGRGEKLTGSAFNAQKRATDHMFANLSALMLFAAARAGHAKNDRPSWWRIASEVCGSGLMTVAGWMGGTLVYRNQIAVDHRYAGAGKWRSQTIAPARAEAGLVDVGADDQLESDQMTLLHVGQRRIVLARNGERYLAFDDRCTHKGGPLSDGSLACGTVQCP